VGFFALIFVGCGAGFKAQDYPIPSICCGPDPSQMVFKTASGRQVVSWSQVSKIDIVILPSNPKDKGLSREFTDQAAQALLAQFNFANPHESGLTSSMITGTITLHFALDNVTDQSRGFNILNGQIVTDQDFANIVYTPGKTLDMAWLQGL
jgi:hypothetical protein